MTSYKYLIMMAALCLVSDSLAFQTISFHKHHSISSFSRCNLHPSQAADLKACADNLTKEFLEQERVKKESAEAIDYNMPVDPNAMAVAPGPLAWCRRRLQWLPLTNKSSGGTLQP